MIPATEPEALTPAHIADRQEILAALDRRACIGCERPAPDDVASNPAWHIDTILVPNGFGAEKRFCLYVDIFCPECW